MKLKDVAREMHTWASEHGHMDYKLANGLKLKLIYRDKCLIYRGSDIVLKMSRSAGVIPSDKEVSICQKAFFGEKELTNHMETDDAVFIAVSREDK